MLSPQKSSRLLSLCSHTRASLLILVRYWSVIRHYIFFLFEEVIYLEAFRYLQVVRHMNKTCCWRAKQLGASKHKYWSLILLLFHCIEEALQFVHPLAIEGYLGFPGFFNFINGTSVNIGRHIFM